MNRILIVEDDMLFAETLADVIEEMGFVADVAHNPKEALERCYGARYALYLLDVRLPGMSGFALLESLRACGDETPAIFLTSLQGREPLAEGFASGADDFLRKPVDTQELELRICALLRRSRGVQGGVVIGERLFVAERMEIRTPEGVLSLKPQEAQLLSLLCSERGRVVEKERIFEELWGGQSSEGALRVYISTLKKALGSAWIDNIRGIGYRLNSDNAP